MPLDAERFVPLFRAAARQAGAAARHLQGKVEVERKGGWRTPESETVTAVDYAAQDILLLRLRERFGDVAVDAEEDTAAARRFPPEAPGRPLVVIDPVDGTLSYTLGSDDWAVMGALILDGFFAASVVELPALELTCFAIRGGGCWLQRGDGPPARVSRLPTAPARLLASPGVEAAPLQRARGRGLEPVLSRCSAVDAIAPVIGRARASIAEGRADRRRSLGFLATLEAGGAVRFGEHAWRGEDPERLPADAAPSVCASDEALAERLVGLV